MSEYQYTIILHPDTEEGGYTVTVPALPGCVTQGETLEEAIAMAKDAIRLHIEGLIEEAKLCRRNMDIHRLSLLAWLLDFKGTKRLPSSALPLQMTQNL